MNRIHLLPDHVANQIAAGEVVERPASVVKELVENALDAQAARILVEVQAGGRSLIRVIDDGVGMSRDDALLCLERHATSKIQRAEDLGSIATMGFRGEALPSIASVSRMHLTTRERTAESPAATQVVIHGGKLLEVKEAGGPSGTTLEVRQLFYNLPARRKFLRSEETEYAHILHYLTLAALAYPHVGFTFVKDGRNVWQLPAVVRDSQPAGALAALRERMRALFGDEQKLIPVDFQAHFAAAPDDRSEVADADVGPATDESESAAAASPDPTRFRLWGFIGQPGVSRSSREDQHLFVNRRPVENRGLNFALVEGYHTALMKGRYPVCCLFLEVDPATVDVNIHPAKREVKFHNERAVRQLTTQAIREALLHFHGGPKDLSPSTSSSSAAAPGHAAAMTRSPDPASRTGPWPGSAVHTVTREFPGFDPLTGTPLSAPARPQARPMPASLPGSAETAAPIGPAIDATSRTRPTEAGPARSWSARATVGPAPAAVELPSPEAASTAPNVSGEPTPLLNVPLRLVGVIGRLYVVLESDRGLVLMDQHAAHERILFEQMIDRVERGEVPCQRLLLPETVELSIRDAQFLREQLPALTRLGVGLSEFGERTFLLDGLPPMVKAREPRRFVLQLVDELKSAGQQVNAQRLGEHTIAKTVCRHAVKANDPLSGPELENLVSDLRHCAMPYTCPHGRPTLIEMSYRELEKKFGRLS
ncbi:MAG TPA: DNA mismatch repair endonuclease MutL [Verrucomicrobiae bacterium]|nr:DNA mismatch repair endonuclease MutL [Verrucomicrobiae bacterium]